MIKLEETRQKLQDTIERIYWNLEDKKVKDRLKNDKYEAIIMRVDEILFTLNRLRINIEEFINECPEVNRNALKEYDNELDTWIKRKNS